MASSIRAFSSNTIMARRASRTPLKVSAFKVTLQMPTGNKTIDVAPNTAVLDAVDAAGVELPYLCRSGACGTCASRVVKGEVELRGQHLLDPEQVKAGFVLLCSSYPKSDVTLRTHQEEELNTMPYGTTCAH